MNLFRNLGLGEEGKDNGILILVTTEDYENITINQDERYIEQLSSEVFRKMRIGMFAFLFLFGLTFVFSFLSGRLRFSIGSSESSDDSSKGDSSGGGRASESGENGRELKKQGSILMNKKR